MRDAERRLAFPWSIYSLNRAASSGYQIGIKFMEEDLPMWRIWISNYRTYSRGTLWLTAHNRSDVTVPMLRATRFAGSTSLPSVP